MRLLSLIALLSGPVLAAPAAEPGCPVGSGLTLGDSFGMGFAPPGLEPSALRNLDRKQILEWAGAWARAYEAAGIDRVVLAPLADDVSSWGAVQRNKPSHGQTFGKFDFFVLDTIVEAFKGKAVLVLSARCPWDHEPGAAPVDRAAFREYVTALVERYDGDASFGVSENDYDSYPDIDGSGKSTISDTQASLQEKLAWAAAHRVLAFQVETEMPLKKAMNTYAAIFADVVDAARNADVELWLAPIPPTVSQSEFMQGVVPLLTAGGRGPDAIIVSVRGVGADFTAASGMDALTRVRKWMRNITFGGKVLVGDVTLGWRKGAGECPDDRCDEVMQAEQAAKVVGLAAANGASGVLYGGVLEVKHGQVGTGLATIDSAVSPDSLALRLALQVMKVVARGLGKGSVAIETGVPSTHAVRSETCEGESDVLAWYDWTLEVGPGQPYQDVVKRIKLDLPFDRVRTAVLGPGLPPADAAATEDNKTTLALGRTPVLVVARAWPEPEMAPEIADVMEGVVPDAAGGGGGGGCGVAPSSLSLTWALLLLSLIWRRGRP